MSPLHEIARKRSRVAEFLGRHDLDAVVLTRRANFAWLTAGCVNHVGQSTDGGVVTLVATPDEVCCVASAIEAPRMRAEELRGRGIEVVEYPWHDAAAMSRTWADVIGGRRAAFDIPVPGLPGGLAALPSGFDELRWSLCEAEEQRYRELGRETGTALQEVCRAVCPGQSEHEVAAALARRLHAKGIRTPVVLIAADDRIDTYRHPLPSERRIDRRVMVVVGAEKYGLHCSATRLMSFEALGGELRRRHDAVVRVDARMIAETRPGRTLGDVFAAAQRAYADEGFADEWQQHHQGGSTGYLGREVKAGPICPARIQAHQAFAWNPSITGTKSEDTILVTPHGTEILTYAEGWPQCEVSAGGCTWARPAILVRS